MQTPEAITSRRHARSFADRPIPAADPDQILEAGRHSRSSQNRQPQDSSSSPTASNVASWPVQVVQVQRIAAEPKCWRLGASQG